MKIAVSADGPTSSATVGHKLGTSRYMLLVDFESGDVEAVPNPGASGERGAGIQAVVLVSSRDVKVVLTGYCNPGIRSQLAANGIEVLTGVSGTVGEAIERYKQGDLQKSHTSDAGPKSGWTMVNRAALARATRSSGRQLATLLPVLVGVVLLIGLFNAFVSEETLASIFSGNAALDTLWGACFGSILAGNPINSYLIGGELLEHGVSLFAVTALVLAWVTVGLVQLPAEMAALGRRFALLRNGLSFIASIPLAILTVVIVNLVVR